MLVCPLSIFGLLAEALANGQLSDILFDYGYP